MAQVLTDIAEQAALEAVLTGTHIALFTAAPADDGTGGTEVTGGGYSRQTWTPTYVQGNPTTAENSGTITWTATADWGDVSHVVIMSAATGGNAHVKLALVKASDPNVEQPRQVLSGDTVKFSPGEITASISSPSA